jgi:hypothetical protein
MGTRAGQQPKTPRAIVKGRVPFRHVSIANSDSGAFAYTHSAIDEGFRAVNDLPTAARASRRRRAARAARA